MSGNVKTDDAPLGLIPHRTAIFPHPPYLFAFGDEAEFTYIRLPRHELPQSLNSDRHVLRMEKSFPTARSIEFFLKSDASDVAKGFGDPFELIGAVRFDPSSVRVIGDEFGNSAGALFTCLERLFGSFAFDNFTL